MKKNLKRLSAFLIDLLIIGLFLMFVYYFVPLEDTTIIQNDIANTTEKLLLNEVDVAQYFKNFSQNIYSLDYSRVVFTAFNTLIISLYFVIIPIITKGYTLGTYISGLKISGDLSIKNLLLRNLITTGLMYLITSISLVYLTTDVMYFILTSILGFIQIILVIISTFMIIYRKDQKGIQDIISNTQVINIKEVKE